MSHVARPIVATNQHIFFSFLHGFTHSSKRHCTVGGCRHRTHLRSPVCWSVVAFHTITHEHPRIWCRETAVKQAVDLQPRRFLFRSGTARKPGLLHVVGTWRRVCEQECLCDKDERSTRWCGCRWKSVAFCSLRFCQRQDPNLIGKKCCGVSLLPFKRHWKLWLRASGKILQQELPERSLHVCFRIFRISVNRFSF